MVIVRRMSSIALVGALVALVLVVIGQPASASDFHRIQNRGNGLCAEVDRFGPIGANGVPVVQRRCEPGLAVQIWDFVSVDPANNLWLILSSPGLCLDVTDGRNADGTPVQHWTCNGASNSMRWQPRVDPSTGAWQLVSQVGNRSRCLDVPGASGAEGLQLQIYRCTGRFNDAQMWFLT